MVAFHLFRLLFPESRVNESKKKKDLRKIYDCEWPAAKSLRLRQNKWHLWIPSRGTDQRQSRKLGANQLCKGRDPQSLLHKYSRKRISCREDWILRGSQSSSFWIPRNLSNHMDRKARIDVTVLVKSRETTGIGPKHCRGGWGEKG